MKNGRGFSGALGRIDNCVSLAIVDRRMQPIVSPRSEGCQRRQPIGTHFRFFSHNVAICCSLGRKPEEWLGLNN